MYLKEITSEEYNNAKKHKKHKKHYRESDMLKFLREFSESSATICEIEEWDKKYRDIWIARNTIATSIKRYGFSMKVSGANNRLFIFKLDGNKEKE